MIKYDLNDGNDPDLHPPDLHHNLSLVMSSSRKWRPILPQISCGTLRHAQGQVLTTNTDTDTIDTDTDTDTTNYCGGQTHRQTDMWHSRHLI